MPEIIKFQVFLCSYFQNLAVYLNAVLYCTGETPKWRYMVEKVLASIKKYNMLQTGESVIIGLSGGADSVALTLALVEIKSIYQLNLKTVHINHGLRGDEALRDENFVVNLSDNLKIPVETYFFDVLKEAKLRGLSCEEAGRLVRYEAFMKAAEALGGAKIAVAHNKNDSAETIIFNLCRGSGLLGLAGIPPVRGNIIRPLIDIEREEIEAYLKEKNAAHIEDSTNSTLCYTRNVIRQMVIPLLKERVNANSVENINNFSHLARDEDLFLNSLARDGYISCLKNEGLDIEKLKSYPETLQKRIIRIALGKFAALRDISFIHIDEILKLTRGISGKTVLLPGQFSVKRDFGLLTFINKTEKKQDFYYDLVYNKTVYVKEADLYVQASKTMLEGSLPFYITDTLAGLTARNRRPGDRIYFKSIKGRKKIKDFFIEHKIPSNERDKILLIAEGPDILWLADGKRNIFADIPENADIDRLTKVYIRVWKGKTE